MNSTEPPPVHYKTEVSKGSLLYLKIKIIGRKVIKHLPLNSSGTFIGKVLRIAR